MIEFIRGEDVNLFMFGWTIERAEITDRRAGVRVINVAVDIKGAVRLRVKPFGHGVGRLADGDEVVRFENRQPLRRREAFAGHRLLEQRRDGRPLGGGVDRVRRFMGYRHAASPAARGPPRRPVVKRAAAPVARPARE